MLGLLAQGFRLLLGPQFLKKSRQARAFLRRMAILVAEIQVIAQSLVIVRRPPGQQVLLVQPRFIATSKFRRDGEHVGISRVAGFVIWCYVTGKTIKIN